MFLYFDTRMRYFKNKRLYKKHPPAFFATGNDNGIEITHIADFLLKENW